MTATPFVIGIDLGTTNTALAWSDTTAAAPDDRHPIEVFPLTQVVRTGEVGTQPLLPSFLYLPQPGEATAGQLQLPWDPHRAYAVGAAAKQQGGTTPTRVVASAKSWLCHGGGDRRAGILPFKGDEKGKKVSPLEASALYLQHLREAWNHAHAKVAEHALEKQEIVLTVPASFDAVARALTVEAAQAAGLPHVTLLEEPQAAFYAWLDAHHADWRDLVQVGDIILVCDVGGGTTDFTLIAVTENQGRLELHRLAVGDHILLGGDNMDLALAHLAQQKLAASGAKLDLAQMQALSHGCRAAKEQLLSDLSLKSLPVSVLGRGRSVIGGALKTELTRAEVEAVLVDGFFPICERAAEPKRTVALGRRTPLLPSTSPRSCAAKNPC